MTGTFESPPVLKPVSKTTPPDFPKRWHAIGLLTPYDGGQLFASEVWYDWSLKAMRVTSFGVDQDSVDLLFIEDVFYVLLSEGAASIGPFPAPQPVPAPDWLGARNMNCQGQGKLMNVLCDWWVGYTPNANGLVNPGPPPKTPIEVCNWVWARSDSGLPFRLFFNNADNPYALPVLGGFAMTHFTEFEEVETTELAEWADKAKSSAKSVPAPNWIGVGLDPLIYALKNMDRKFGSDAPSGSAGKLIAGLKPAPSDSPIPKWPPRLCITGYTIPTAKHQMFSAAALPMRVFYDWENQRMLTRVSTDVTRFDGAPVEDMILNSSMTYIVGRQPGKPDVNCIGTKSVGIPKPDWAADDDAKPRAVIVDNPVLCPGKTLNVTVAPNPPSRSFWLWYTENMDGVLFMEVPQFGDVGLVVTDYYSFDANPPEFPDSAFVVPKECIAKFGGS